MIGRSRFDVAISGGGVAGMTLAALLARGGDRSVAIVEATEDFERLPDGAYDPQVLALSPASQRILAAIGAWQALPAGRIGPYRHMHVWDALGAGSIDFDAAELMVPALGYIVEQRELLAALQASLSDRRGVTWIRPDTLAEFTSGPDAVEAVTGEGRRLSARLLVAADGAGSSTRRQAGIDSAVRSYRQRAVVATVRLLDGHRQTAWQRFLADGPLAVLPMAEADRATIVWSTTPERADQLTAANDAAFADELTAALAGRLGAFDECSARRSFPLQRATVEQYWRGRVVLLGDAAHQIHPLAGQGANLALLDAAALAECLSDPAAAADPFSPRRLRRYQRWRGTHNRAVQQLMDGFYLLFGRRCLPLRALRNAGLAATGACGPLKIWLMRRACGLGGHLPRVARAPGS